jgi:hypothetical protein
MASSVRISGQESYDPDNYLYQPHESIGVNKSSSKSSNPYLEASTIWNSLEKNNFLEYETNKGVKKAVRLRTKGNDNIWHGKIFEYKGNSLNTTFIDPKERRNKQITKLNKVKKINTPQNIKKRIESSAQERR